MPDKRPLNEPATAFSPQVTRVAAAVAACAAAWGANGCQAPPYSSSVARASNSDAGTVPARAPSESGTATPSLALPASSRASRIEPSEPQARDSQLDPDGDDDSGVAQASHAAIETGRFVRVGRAPLALQRICDLTEFGPSLYAAHATRPLGLDGATITRYSPDDQKPFSVAFDWNRSGEPSKGGGAGQGFLRVHSLQGRLFVADADPPYNGFGISEPGTEGFVFVSTAAGEFAQARMPGHLPPRPPDPQGRAGAAVLPRAYHVIDVIRFRGALYAATGSVPKGQRAWHGASPAALQRESEIGARFEYAADYPNPYQNGVWRFTFMVRFRDRLYAGLQDYDQREPNDYVYFAPPRDVLQVRQEDMHPMRVTESGTAQTLRWYADAGALYWIAWNSAGVALRVTQDGDAWRVVPLPRDAGVPTDIVRFRGALHVLMTHALVRLGNPEAGDTTVLWRSAEKRSPFELDDSFCAAPLAVFRDTLYAGGQRDGALYRFQED